MVLFLSMKNIEGKKQPASVLLQILVIVFIQAFIDKVLLSMPIRAPLQSFCGAFSIVLNIGVQHSISNSL